MLFISHVDSQLYSGDRAHWRDVPATSDPPSPHHRPVIESGEHVGWELDEAGRLGIRKDYTSRIQQHLDATAQQRGYDGILSLCTYATSSNATFAAEGQAGVEWRDAVWSRAYEILDEVEDGTREVPTEEELIALLPEMQWPD